MLAGFDIMKYLNPIIIRWEDFQYSDIYSIYNLRPTEKLEILNENLYFCILNQDPESKMDFWRFPVKENLIKWHSHWMLVINWQSWLDAQNQINNIITWSNKYKFMPMKIIGKNSEWCLSLTLEHLKIDIFDKKKRHVCIGLKI